MKETGVAGNSFLYIQDSCNIVGEIILIHNKELDNKI